MLVELFRDGITVPPGQFEAHRLELAGASLVLGSYGYHRQFRNAEQSHLDIPPSSGPKGGYTECILGRRSRNHSSKGPFQICGAAVSENRKICDSFFVAHELTGDMIDNWGTYVFLIRSSKSDHEVAPKCL